MRIRQLGELTSLSLTRPELVLKIQVLLADHVVVATQGLQDLRWLTLVAVD